MRFATPRGYYVFISCSMSETRTSLFFTLLLTFTLSLQKRIATIKEEIGRNYHSTNSNPHSLYNILDDVEVNIFPTKMGMHYQVNIRTKDKELNKIFPSEEEAQVWSKNQVIKLSKKFTQ